MSTNNFKFENILIVLPSFNYDYKKPCNCCNDSDCAFSELDSMFDNKKFTKHINNLRNELIEKLKKDNYLNVSDVSNRLLNDRNYSGQEIFEVDIEGKNGTYRTINVLYRCGYYDGINLDYIIGDINEDNYTNELVGLENKTKATERKIIKILRKYGKEWKKVGQFSNGEAFYSIKK